MPTNSLTLDDVVLEEPKSPEAELREQDNKSYTLPNSNHYHREPSHNPARLSFPYASSAKAYNDAGYLPKNNSPTLGKATYESIYKLNQKNKSIGDILPYEKGQKNDYGRSGNCKNLNYTSLTENMDNNIPLYLKPANTLGYYGLLGKDSDYNLSDYGRFVSIARPQGKVNFGPLD